MISFVHGYSHFQKIKVPGLGREILSIVPDVILAVLRIKAAIKNFFSQTSNLSGKLNPGHKRDV